MRLNHDLFKFNGTTRGSYGVFAARVLKLDYPTFLRYCRDRLGADLIGKRSLYVTPYYLDNQETRMFVKLLNARMDFIMNVVNSPYDFVEKDGEIVRSELK